MDVKQQACVPSSLILACYLSPVRQALGISLNQVELGTLMHLIKEVDSMKSGILPHDYIETEANETDADLVEDFNRLNLLNSKLKVAIQSGDTTNTELLLTEVVALVSGIEGLFRNVADDSRDVLKGVYRHT
jgi:hypothetical protein